MNHLYITYNINASQYAISLDEIFMTLYGFGKKRKITSPRKGFKKESYDSTAILTEKGVPGVVYRIEVSAEQHDAVRDILCDFLMEYQRQRLSLRRDERDFSSAEFIAYILDQAGIINFEGSENGIADEDLSHITDFDNVNVIYEGDLKKYVADKKERSEAEHSNIRHLHSIKKNKEVMEHGTAQYEYVPNKMKVLVTAD